MAGTGRTRRELLAGGAGLAAASAVGLYGQGTRARSRTGRASRRVIVVGAGLAGLTAAYELDRSGWDVVVLEARSRVGGRVLTVRDFAAGQLAEAGGEFIDLDHTALLGYVRRFGLRLDDMRTTGSDLPRAIFVGGRRFSEDEYTTPAVTRDVDRYTQRLDALAYPIDPGNPPPGNASLDRQSAATLINGMHLDPRARRLVTHDTIVDDYTVEPSQLSLLAQFAAQNVGPDLPDSGYEAYRVHGGNDQVPNAFARALGPRVQLEAPVTAIAWGPGGVQVTAAGETLNAPRCVIATPLPPLRAVRFSPALPPALAGAIQELQYGIGTKVLLQYRRRFWIEQGFGGDTMTDLPVSSTWAATNAQPGTPGILVAYTMGSSGRRFTALDDAARIAAAVRDLDRIYPGSRRLFTSAFTIAWAREQYTRGTYSAYAPGQVTRFWSAIRKPLGPIVLAGEHTSEYWGYMEGAVRSGRRAAGEIAG